MRVTVWNEFLQERTEEQARSVYPDGIHSVISQGLTDRLPESWTVRVSTMEDDQLGLSEDVLADTDVLIWWSHLRNDEVPWDVVDRVVQRVHAGMGLIALHSGGGSRPFRALIGTGPGDGGYRHGDREVMWTVDPGHPITDGVRNPVVFDRQEMYGEPSGLPYPQELVFISAFEGGEVHRSGACYKRGQGKIFYFSPGHEEYPIYYRDDVQHIIANAVRWAAPTPSAIRRVTGERPMGWYEHEAVTARAN